MKKFIAITVFTTLILIKATAQTPTFGIDAGVTLSSIIVKVDNDKTNSKSKIGFTAGIVSDIPLGKSISFRPALHFTQMGGVEKESEESVTVKEKITLNYIELPLNFVYKAEAPTSTFFAGLGPSLSYGISGKDKLEISGEDSEDTDINFGNSDDDDLKPFNVGGNVIAGFEFAGGLFIAANYNLGLSNLFIDGDSNNSFRTSYAGLRIGYLFGGKKITATATQQQ